jgi:hypothetical protein
MQSLDSESSYNDSRHYAVLNKYVDYIEESNPEKAKKFYAAHHSDYPANVELRNTLKKYGFYRLDKYQNIHNIEITRIDIFKDETLLLRKCDWFELSYYNYDYRADNAKRYCTQDYIKVADEPVLSKAITQEFADEKNTSKLNKENDYKLARDEATLRFLVLFLGSLVISFISSFLIKKFRHSSKFKIR